MDTRMYACSFRTGFSFGDRAMIGKQGRAGTCVAIEDTYLAIITKKNFDRFLKK